MTDDAELLRRYVDLRTEAAFAQFVSRHLGLVYFAALRRTCGNVALAEDVAQAVFTAAARDARNLARHAAVTGWLYTTTRFIAAKIMRQENTRRRLELEAAQTRELSAGGDAADWERLRPVIDEALEELSARDRESVLLRFFEGQPFAAIGRAARISEDAARMRVERALDRLRSALQRRGVTSTGAALAFVLAREAAGAAPGGFAATVTGAAIAGATATGSVAAGATLMVFMSTTKGAACLALAALVAGGFAVREQREATLAKVELVEAQREHGVRQESLRAVERRAGEAGRAVATATAQSARSSEEQGKANGRALMARHPEVKAAFERWSAGQVSASFAPFFQTQNLASAQIERFKELHRGRHSFGWESSDDTGATESLFLESPLVAPGPAFVTEMQALLGPDGFRAYQAYERTRAAREVVLRIGAALAFGEAPLTSEQAAQLVQIVDTGVVEGRETIARFNWDLVAERARPLLAPAQFAAVARLKAEERHDEAWRQALKRSKP